jgi:hypothetical protein
MGQADQGAGIPDPLTLVQKYTGIFFDTGVLVLPGQESAQCGFSRRFRSGDVDL